MQTIHPGVDNTDVTPTALNCTAVTAAAAACRTQLRTQSTFEYLIIKYVCLVGYFLVCWLLVSQARLWEWNTESF